MRPPNLRKKQEFDRVFKSGLNFSTRYLVMYASPNKLCFSRFGLSVSKKIGCAVIRNRVKRLLRETMRSLLKGFPYSYDFVLVARKPSAEAKLKDILPDVEKILSRLTK